MLVSCDSFRLNPKGAFIALEGLNGVGKSTLSENLSKFLCQKGLSVVSTREPGGTALGRSIRALLLEPEFAERSPLAELFLFAADRAEHSERLIHPALEEGKTVLCDRYLYSTLAFQGYGRGLDLEQLSFIQQIAVGTVLPDLVVLLDLDPLEAIKRLNTRAQKLDSLEAQDLAFHQRVRAGFLKIAEQRKESFLVLDAKNSADQLLEQIITVLE